MSQWERRRSSELDMSNLGHEKVCINEEKVVINIRIGASPGLSIVGKSEALSNYLNICPALPCSLRESGTCALSLKLSLGFMIAYMDQNVCCRL
jgi:hypothetical protein